MEYYGVPAVQLSDEELRRECAQAEATREWAFHNATDEQFQQYGIRMLELEQEYLRRQLKRQALSWRVVVEEVSRVGSTVRGLVAQMETRVDGYFVRAAPALQSPPAMPALTGPAVDDPFPPRLDVGQPVARAGAGQTSWPAAAAHRARRVLAAGLDRFRLGAHLARHAR
jgi:hypothetical protein